MSIVSTTATPRLSAADLGITKREYTGLIEVRDDLASGKIKHIEVVDSFFSIELTSKDWNSRLFNMSSYHTYSECGTAHCIAGFMQVNGVYPIRTFHPSICSLNLRDLFLPRMIKCCDWQKLTTSQAVRAIDHFLAGAGFECWSRALIEEPLATA